jgi:putative transposase
MSIIDTIYTKYPFYGNRRIKHELNRTYGIAIGRKHVRTLMQKMCIQAIFPTKKTSISNKEHAIYPYLLKGVNIKGPNHVWSTDITYIRLEKGFAYLVAIIDWFSRYVINWKLSNTLEIDFCLECLNETMHKKEKPEIFNSDQGSQFTSTQFTDILKDNDIQISMDGRGRCLDNIFVERLWRSVKQENLYLHNYTNITEARKGLTKYFQFYNTERRHQSLEYKTPKEVHFQ